MFLKYRTSKGARVWRRFIGSGAALDERVADVASDASGRVYAAGTTQDDNFTIDHGFLSSLSAAGDSAWTDVFWLASEQDSQFQVVSAGAAGGCAGGGWADTVIGGKDFVVRYFNTSGPAVVWSFLTGDAIGDDFCRSVLVRGTAVYVAGEVYNGAASSTDAALFKLDVF